MREKFAVQLYTLRNEIKEDFPSVLKDLKKMGWSAVQMTIPEGYKAEEIAELTNELGIKTAGMHFSIERIQNDLDNIVKEMELFNTKDLICPYLTEEWRNEKGYKVVKETLTEAANKLAPKGYRVSYHNHAFEFETEIYGKNALEYLIEPSETNQILAELDVYWLKKAGKDPLTFIQKYANRMPIIHLKDMTDDAEQTFAEVGSGSIDFEPILKWCDRSGVEWLVVEQDQCSGEPMDSLQISLDNLNNMVAVLEKK
ncbi:sugar phosphate isomerase/epimerase family protein [Alkalihalobacillus sp. 1P02AB]|uniref:sugar phosphate isomerase/epimerase family protein n=1 Tax=Alkalihalobacillus sp. 1P02AB TaxID=3132260 RepID=UPI0039A65AAA